MKTGSDKENVFDEGIARLTPWKYHSLYLFVNVSGSAVNFVHSCSRSAQEIMIPAPDNFDTDESSVSL